MSRITIIHGPNGVGKTVLMRMVHGILNYDYKFLTETPFNQLHIEFSDGEFISVQKEKDDDNVPLLLISYEDSTGEAHHPYRLSISREKILPQLVKEVLPDAKRVLTPNEKKRHYWIYHDKETGYPEALIKEDILREYPTIHTQLYGEPPDWFAQILNKENPKLISTSRLKIETMENELILAMEWQSRGRDIFPTPDDAVSEIAIDFRFLARDLMDARAKLEAQPAKIDELSAKLAKLNERISEFEGVLAQDDMSSNPNISSLLEKHLEDYMEDRELLHQDLQEAIELRNSVLAPEMFLDIINGRILFKSLQIANTGIDDEDHEIIVVAEDGSEIPSTGLSSGEQQLLVLYYQLIFEIQPDTLVMIDEPELSMNVVWQRNFLKDLQRIIELRKFDVLIATHSPEVIYDKWDWTVALGEKAND